MSRKIMLTMFLLMISVFTLSAVNLDGVVIAGESGEPVAGAMLHLHQGNMEFFETNTNESGEFIFEDLETGNYMLFAEAEDYEPYMEMLELNEDMSVSIELMETGNGGELTGHLFGAVYSEDGEAVTGAEIVISTWNQNIHPHHQVYEAITGETGNYDFSEIIDNSDYEVMVITGDQPYMTEVYVEGETEFDIEITGNEPGENWNLSGIVTNAETSEPVPGIEILLHGWQGFMMEAVTGEAGNYEFPQVPEGEYELIVHGNYGYEMYTAEIEIFEDTVYDIELIPIEQGDITLSGIIIEEETGEPLPDLAVHLWAENTPGGMLMGFSNEEGYYEINNIMAGEYLLTVNGMQGMNLYEEEIVIEEDMVYDIVIAGTPGENGNLNGMVLNVETGEFVPGAQIMIQHGWQVYETVSGEAGQYAFEGVPVQNYQLIAMAAGYHQYNTQIEIEEETVFEIALEPLPAGDYTLSGMVTDEETDEIIPGVHIQMFSEQGYNFNAFTNESGQYEITGVFAGTYQMMAWVNNWNMYEPFEATIEIMEDTVFDFALQPIEMPGTGSITGQIFDADTMDPIPEALLHIAPVEGGGGCWHFYEAISDEDGNFEFPQVEEGEYILAAEAAGYVFSYFEGVSNPEDATILEVTEEEALTVEMLLEPLVFHIVSGNVLDYSSQEALEGAYVRALLPGTGCNHWAISEAITDLDGNFSLELPQGEYIFAAEFGDFHSEEFMQQFYDHKQSPANADVVTVSEDISGIDFELAAPEQYDNQISGTISVGGNVPENPVLVAAVSGGNQWEAATVTDMFGNYLLNNLPEGEFYILAYEYNSVPTYYPGVIDFEDAEIVLAQGSVTGIDFELIVPESNGIYQVDGYVLDTDDAPVANANVVFMNDSGDVLSYAVTNNDGYYQANNLPSGSLNGLATKVLYNSDEQNISVTVTGNADFVIAPQATTAENPDAVASTTCSLANYPNPFNPTTTISFNLPQAGFTNLSVYNVAGQKVASLVEDQLSSGPHSIVWDGMLDNGQGAASGIYFYKLQSGEQNISRKMILMK